MVCERMEIGCTSSLSLGVPMQGNSKSEDADVTVCERVDGGMGEAG